MSNLYRELAPISDAAWADIEEETSRTLKRYLAARRVVDVHGPGGVALSAIGTGHLRTIKTPDNGILARQRDVNALVELRVPFELNRQQVDDVGRGAETPTGSRLRTRRVFWPLPRTARFSTATRRPASAAFARAPAIQ